MPFQFNLLQLLVIDLGSREDDDEGAWFLRWKVVVIEFEFGLNGMTDSGVGLKI
jgi:hypothetical protein